MKVLCFTYSYHRPKMLRSCIMDILNQNYKYITHVINITYDKEDDLKYYTNIFSDLYSDRLKYCFNINQHQQINAVNAIKCISNYEDYDIFVKIDDDDIYKSNYITNIVDVMSSCDVDICSSRLNFILNGYRFKFWDIKNLGGSPEGSDFNIPSTFAFNKKALELVLSIKNYDLFEDTMWMNIWYKNGLIHKEVNNTSECIWYVHGGNTSTSDLFEK